MFVLLTTFAACSGPRLQDADEVRQCLSDGTVDFSELPLSDTATVFAMDFGPNSVQIFVEPTVDDVGTELAGIRAAEDEVGNTGSSRVILRSEANVLVSWANEPTSDQREPVERCVGFA